MMHSYHLGLGLRIFAQRLFHPQILPVAYFSLVSVRPSCAQRKDEGVIELIDLLCREEFLEQQISRMPVVMVAGYNDHVWTNKPIKLNPCLFKLNHQAIVCQVTSYENCVRLELIDLVNYTVKDALHKKATYMNIRYLHYLQYCYHYMRS